MSELCDKAHFLLDFIPICVVGPEEDVQGDSASLPDQLQWTVLDVSAISDRRQSNVQESNGRCKTDQWDEEDGVESDEVGEGDRVQELDLDQRVLRVDVEVNVYHDVEDDDQGKDNYIWSDTLYLSNHIDRGEWDKHFEALDVDRLDGIASRIWAIQCALILLWRRLVVLLQEVIEYFEDAQYRVKYGRSPDETGVVLDLIVWDTNLIVLNLLVDIIQLQVKLIDHRSVREVTSTFSWLATRDVDSVKNLVHTVRSVHLEQVLIDRKQLSVFYLLD